jgi:hypothetical protein
MRGARIEAAFVGMIERRWMRALIAGLEILVGVVAVISGVLMLRSPEDAFGSAQDILAGSPFDTWTGPGLLLLVLVGLAPLVVAALVIMRRPPGLLLSVAWGIGLVVWIVVQWFLLADTLWLQPVLAAVGVVVAATAALAISRGMR